MLLATVMVARAVVFSETAPTGQTLYYEITSASTVKVVSGTDKPTGRLTIPATAQGYSVTEIASMAFSGCTGLTSVSIPGSVATVGMRAFASCSALTSAHLAEGVQTIGQMAFSSCTALDTINLPTTLTKIAAGVFGNTAIINNIDDWQDSVLYICHYLITSRQLRTGTLMVTDGTLGIANLALDSRQITKCVLPEGLHFIGEQAFLRCSQLDTVHTLDSVPTALGDNAFQGGSANLTILVPCGCAAAYNAAPNWNTLNIVEDTCPTPPTPPDPPVSIQNAGKPMFKATVNGNILTVSGAEGQLLMVTDIAGRRIYSAACAQHDIRVALPAKGFYIVSIGTSAPLKVCYSR